MINIFIILLAVCFGAFFTYLFLRSKLKNTEQINNEIKTENFKLEKDNESLVIDNKTLKTEKTLLQQQNNEAQQYLNTLNENIIKLEKQSIEAGEIFYNNNMDLAQKRLQEALKIEQTKYEEAIAAYSKQFLDTMQDSAKIFKLQMEEYNKECDALRVKENELQNTVNAAVEAAKRVEEMKTKVEFYKLQLTEIDLEEIQMLRDISTHLRNQEPLNKVIWKVYYEKPTSDLIGRVIGSGVHTGIYKITNLNNDKCYVGQAVNCWPMKNFTRLSPGV